MWVKIDMKKRKAYTVFLGGHVNSSIHHGHQNGVSSKTQTWNYPVTLLCHPEESKLGTSGQS